MASGSPKRKRDQTLLLDTTGSVSRLAFDGDGEDTDDASPRTKTARRFERLEIDSLQSQWRSEVGSKPEADPTDQVELFAQTAGQYGKATSTGTRLGASAPTHTTLDTPLASEKTSSERVANSSRSRSPPLSPDVSEGFWQISEITGHDPDDPDDDGYGINGIGFRPTAAIAWSRSQRRKQQLSDYRNREARDARQQRSERRKRVISDGDDIPSTESSPRKSIRVHFEDG